MLHNDELRLVVVIPVYGNWDDTLATLRALEVQRCRRFRVLIADDGSPGPVPQDVHSFEFAEYVRKPNLGFAGNCNRAAEMAIDQGATHILFLNNDTDFGPDFVGGWLSVAERTPQAIVSPIIHWFDRPAAVWFSGGPFTLLTPFVRLREEFRETTAVDIVCGCALLVPATEWRRLGGFDETYAVYFEDFDFSLRAKAAGIPIYVDPNCDLRVRHKVSGSFRKDKAWKQQYYLLASRLIFIRRHAGGWRRPISYVLTVLHLMAVFADNLPQIPNPRLLLDAVEKGLVTGEARNPVA